MSVIVAVSWGELLDKISILEIKRDRLTDPAQLANVEHEHATLCAARDKAMPEGADVSDSFAGLRIVNETLWDIEDDIRDCERDKDFGPRFVELARAVYINNDQRGRHQTPDQRRARIGYRRGKILYGIRLRAT